MHAHSAPRILISRLSHIGDVILTVPLLNALRRGYPDAYLAWAVEKTSATVLEGHTALDELIVLDKGWLKSPARLARLRSQLLGNCFDVAIDPQGLTRSSVVSWLSGAPIRIGLSRPLGREISPWLNNSLVQPRQEHVVDRTLELLRPLGIKYGAVHFDLPARGDALQSVARLLAGYRFRDRFMLINVGAGWASRQWPAQRFAEVARALGNQRRVGSLVAWHGEEERQLAETVVAGSGGQAQLAPPTSLHELAALLRSAQLYLGSDTGPMHLSVAVGTPVVSLHGTTRPEQSGPYGSGHTAIQRYYQDGTSRQRRKADNEAMQAIDIETVIEACLNVIDGRTEKTSCAA